MTTHGNVSCFQDYGGNMSSTELFANLGLDCRHKIGGEAIPQHRAAALLSVKKKTRASTWTHSPVAFGHFKEEDHPLVSLCLLRNAQTVGHRVKRLDCEETRNQRVNGGHGADEKSWYTNWPTLYISALPNLTPCGLSVPSLDQWRHKLMPFVTPFVFPSATHLSFFLSV